MCIRDRSTSITCSSVWHDAERTSQISSKHNYNVCCFDWSFLSLFLCALMFEGKQHCRQVFLTLIRRLELVPVWHCTDVRRLRNANFSFRSRHVFLLSPNERTTERSREREKMVICQSITRRYWSILSALIKANRSISLALCYSKSSSKMMDCRSAFALDGE